MGIINRIFNGKLNLDVSPYQLPPADYSDALNITRDAQVEGQDRIVTNIKGNQQVLYTLPSGTNKRIGSRPDPVRNRIYIWVWNSNNHDLILYYDKSTDTIIKLIENIADTDDIDVLNFNPSYRINHVDIIYRDEGDLISWTDGLNSPREINETLILSGEYPIIKTQFIEVAKRPPLSPPTAVYGSDSTRNSNSLRRKLFMFTHWFVEDNDYETSPSTLSKIPMPIGFYGSDNDIDSDKNNFITITVQTGDENVKKIRIAMRNNIANAWSDFVLIADLDKEELSIPDNVTYDFLFYNDALYPPIDVKRMQQLFDWVPQKANSQCQPNGNVKDYGGITEGYDNYPVSELDVTITAANQTNIPPDSDPPAISYVRTIDTYVFSVTGSVPVGTIYKVIALANVPPPSVITLALYTSVLGDTINDVAQEMFNYINTNHASYAQAVGGNTFTANLPPGSSIIQVVVTPGSSGSSISTEKTWLWRCNYLMGIVYVDEQNRDMPGVTTFASPVNNDNDFLVTTPPFSLSGADVQTPVISASINHLPPAGAKKYYWVRRRLQYGEFVFYETCDFKDDPDSDGHLYFCLANIEEYKKTNSQFIYGTAPINPESRIQIIAGITAGGYNGNLWTQDYQILGVVTKTLTGGTSPGDDKLFIKVKKPDGAISPAYTPNMLVKVYTPMPNPSSLEDSVYWEWGEAYDIYTMYTIGYLSLVGIFTAGETITGGTSGATGTTVYVDGLSQMKVDNVVGVFIVGETITGGTSGATASIDSVTPINYHRGMDQDQTALQQATFTWPEGDVYFHQRTMYADIIAPFVSDILNIMDANWSDFFDSAVNDNGRGQAIEVNAKRAYYPTLIRFSHEYEQSTNINGTNRFYFENADEYDRSFGDIEKMFIEGRYKYVFQKFDIGVVPILMQIIKDTSGNPLEANSDILLNKITYPYKGQMGMGDVPESFAYGKWAKYGIDSNKGVVYRLSQDGITVLSVLYECNVFFISKLAAFKKELNNGYPPPGGVYKGDPTAHGIFDSYTNKYIITLEEINRYDINGNLIFHQDAETISFLETRDSSEGFESKYSYHSEGMDSLNNLLVSFKNGALWKHDSNTLCNFYGVQYDAYIQGVFNDSTIQKKTWQAITQIANKKWSCPVIYTNLNTYGSQRQESNLVEAEFEILEGNPSSSIKRDVNSRGGKVNGDLIKGNHIVITFKKANASELVSLAAASVSFIDSPLTIK